MLQDTEKIISYDIKQDCYTCMYKTGMIYQ